MRSDDGEGEGQGSGRRNHPKRHGRAMQEKVGLKFFGGHKFTSISQTFTFNINPVSALACPFVTPDSGAQRRKLPQTACFVNDHFHHRHMKPDTTVVNT